jgi:hypothetical protein
MSRHGNYTSCQGKAYTILNQPGEDIDPPADKGRHCTFVQQEMISLKTGSDNMGFFQYTEPTNCLSRGTFEKCGSGNRYYRNLGSKVGEVGDRIALTYRSFLTIAPKR